MAIDVGAVRIGVAVAPAGADLAVPVETVSRGPGDVQRVVALVGEHGAERVFVGDPVTLAGAVGQAALAARRFATELANQLAGVDVRMVDERLTTAQSARQLQAAGRDTRKSRTVIDQAAAVAILQNAVDLERATGRLAGARVEQDDR